MKIKLDENIPVGLRDLLAVSGHNVDTAAEEGVVGQDDPVVWSAAKRAGRFLQIRIRRP